MKSKTKGAARPESAAPRALASKRSPFSAGLAVSLPERLARQMDGLAAGDGITAAQAVEWLCRQAVIIGDLHLIGYAMRLDLDPEESGSLAAAQSADAALRGYQAETKREARA